MNDEVFKLIFYIKDDKYRFTALYTFETEKAAADAFNDLKDKYSYYYVCVHCEDRLSSKIYWSKRLR